jgi:hypothetical protein
MSDMDARDDGRLDRSLSACYGDLAGAPVPVRLHGRIVRTIQARDGRRASGHGLRRGLGRLAPAALAVVFVAAVAVAVLPWAQHGTIAPTGPTASATAGATGSATASATASRPPMATAVPPTAVPTAFPAGATRITAVNLGETLMTVTIGGNVVGQLACGETGIYAVTAYPSTFEVAVDEASASTVLVRFSAPMWWIYRPDGFTVAETAPPVNRGYAVCPTPYAGSDPSGVVTWSFDYPTVTGTTADAAINSAVSASAERWAGQLAGDLLTLRAARSTPTGTGSLTGYWAADTSIPGWLSITVSMNPTLDPAPVDGIPTWTADLVFDLSDGHRVGVDELFTKPADGLAVLSAQTRKLMGLTPDGGIYAAATTPDALASAMWYPQCDGVRLVFADPVKASLPTASLYQTEVLIPWSALKSVLATDSPIHSVKRC